MIKYTMILKIEVGHDFEGVENMKGDREYAEGVCRMIADEVATAGGVASYDVIESTVNVGEHGYEKEKKNFLINRFMNVN